MLKNKSLVSLTYGLLPDILRTNSTNIVASGSYRNNIKLPIFRPFKKFCVHGILMTQVCGILCRGSIMKHPVFSD